MEQNNMQALPVDIHHVSFSRKGAYLCITGRNEAQCRDNPHLHIRPGLWLRNFHDEGRRDVFLLEPVRDGAALPCTPELSPDELCLRVDGGGTVRLCLSAAETLRIRVEGASLRLSMLAHLGGGEFRIGANAWRVNCPGALRDYTICSVTGSVAVDRARRDERDYVDVSVAPSGGATAAEAVLIQSKGQAELPETWPAYESARQAVRDDFEAFHRRNADVPPELADTARLAAYVNWSSFIAPCGNMTREGMLMSKNWMGNIWSWDHCFNEIGRAHV